MTEEERRTLLAIARASICARLAGTAYDPPAATGRLAEPGCAFVTLRVQEALRGCIGSTEPSRPLTRVVARCAAAAATEDPRFPAVPLSLLGDVRIEISVLTPMEPVGGVEQIDVGRHGLLISSGARRGLLLPQVPAEWGWDREAFLAHTCVKAGLRPDAWRTGAAIFRFEAEIFDEAIDP